MFVLLQLSHWNITITMGTVAVLLIKALHGVNAAVLSHIDCFASLTEGPDGITTLTLLYEPL